MTETEATELVNTPEVEDIGAGDALLEIEKGSDRWTLRGSDAWTMGNIHEIDDRLREVEAGDFPAIRLVTEDVDHFDTGGAWLIERLRRTAQKKGRPFEHVDGGRLHKELVDVMRPHEREQAAPRSRMPSFSMRPVENLGRAMAGFGNDFIMGCNLIGASLQGSQMKSGKRGSMRGSHPLSTNLTRWACERSRSLRSCHSDRCDHRPNRAPFSSKAFGEEC